MTGNIQRYRDNLRDDLNGAALYVALAGAGGDSMGTQPVVNGLTTLSASRGVTETLDRLESLATGRGLAIFAHINFSADARRAGLNLRPTELLILGSPKAGTPLMAGTPTLAIDLPLKVLAWEGMAGSGCRTTRQRTSRSDTGFRRSCSRKLPRWVRRSRPWPHPRKIRTLESDRISAPAIPEALHHVNST